MVQPLGKTVFHEVKLTLPYESAILPKRKENSHTKTYMYMCVAAAFGSNSKVHHQMNGLTNVVPACIGILASDI